MDKICHICGTDCSNKPRMKDNKGRYFCKACYEKALRAKRAQRAKKADAARPRTDEGTPSAGAASTPASPTPESPPQPAQADPQPRKPSKPEFEGSLLEAAMDDLAAEQAEQEELIAAGEPPKNCPNCGAEVPFDAVICTECGFNFQTGQGTATTSAEAEKAAEKKRRAERKSELIEQFQTPGGIAFLVLLVFAALLAGSFFVPVVGLAYLGAWVLLGIVVWVWVLIAAFRHNILHGLASLIVPLYGLVYLFAFCEDARPKLLFGVYVLAGGAYIALAVLMGTEILPEAVPQAG
jgi:hypothetical protein